MGSWISGIEAMDRWIDRSDRQDSWISKNKGSLDRLIGSIG